MIVCVQYFNAPEYFWGCMTLMFTVIPSVIVHVFSARWYLLDDDMTTSDWLLHVFQLGTLKRYVCVFQTGLEARLSHDSSDFDLLYHQQSDVSMLRLFESFMESAPQLVLQLYIMVATNDENYFTGVSAAVSLISLCWAIAAYSKAQRKMRMDKAHISWPGLIFQTLWRIGMVSSRIMALVLFASIFKAYIFPVVAAHWLVMFLWVYHQDTDFCQTWPEERLFNVIISIIYIFCFFNLKEGSSRFRIVAFYTVIFIEDTILVVLWSLNETDNQYNTAGYTIVFGGFFIGIFSMIIYYRCFHPSGQISLSTTILKDIEKHCPHDHVYTSPGSTSCGLDAELSFRSRSISPDKYPGDCSFTSEKNNQLNYSVTSYKSSPKESCNSGILATQRTGSDSCLLDLTTRTRKAMNQSSINCLVDNELTCELGLTFTDYRLNCTGFASILAEQYDTAKDRALASSTHTQGMIENDLASSHMHGTLEDHLASTHIQCNGSLEDSLDMTQGSSLQDMPNMSLQTPGLMSRYEAEKIYLDILDQQRPSVPSQKKLIFKSRENMGAVAESNKSELKKKKVETPSETTRKRVKPYILWKLDNKRKSKERAGGENGIQMSCNVSDPQRKERYSENIPKVNCQVMMDNGIEDKASELNKEVIEVVVDNKHNEDIPEKMESKLNEESHKTCQFDGTQPKKSSFGHGRPQQREVKQNCKHSFKSSTTYESTPGCKQSFISSEASPKRKHSFKSTERKHSFKSTVTNEACPKRKDSLKSVNKPYLPNSPSIYDKENSPQKPSSMHKGFEVGSNVKHPKAFRSPVLQEVIPTNNLLQTPITSSKSSVSTKPCSPSVRSLQLSIFSPENMKSPGSTEKKGRRSLGKIPLNVVADKISMFTK